MRSDPYDRVVVDSSARDGALLAGVRVVECALLSANGVGQHLADLGADVIKVERPGEGDYGRRVGWPIVDGVSLEHWHWNRGKRSIAIDLRAIEGAAVFASLAAASDIVIEGMRPGALDRLGVGHAVVHQRNERMVWCQITGYGDSGPYRDIPSHGLAFDSMAGIAPPIVTADGFPSIPPHTSIGFHAGPLLAAFGVVSAVLRARETGRGCRIEVAQSDAAVAWNWLKIEGEVAYERPDAEVSGNFADGVGPRRVIGFDDFGDAVRYQYYATRDGHVLLMASERKFFRNFCDAVGRPDLFSAHPGGEVAEHAVGNVALRRELTTIFGTRTTAEWMTVAAAYDIPLAPVHDAIGARTDAHTASRLRWLPRAQHGADLIAVPINVSPHPLPAPSRAPTVGEHTDTVLRDVLGHTDEQIASLREKGAVA
jgi:crotonobetainyl-CoA:carnitine CoA-transferase CaiB-like acyl-CoA transferase